MPEMPESLNDATIGGGQAGLSILCYLIASDPEIGDPIAPSSSESSNARQTLSKRARVTMELQQSRVASALLVERSFDGRRTM